MTERLVCLLLIVVVGVCSADRTVEYGVDISFPMHHAKVSMNYDYLPFHQNQSFVVPLEYRDVPIQPLGDRQSFYDHYMEGCRNRYHNLAPGRCDNEEENRISMTLRQPQSMRNYTRMGFTKLKAPKQLFQPIVEFWQRNKHRSSRELWRAGNVYTNHWESPTDMVPVEEDAMDGGGRAFKAQIWEMTRDIVEEWTGQQLVECSLYGIRVYRNGAVLAPHVDRLPLVSSAIINVDQDVDEPWPLEVIGHDGKAHNVTMEPGDLVLYESHSVIHGRPFPLKGRFMANLFVHFEPVGKLDGQVEYNGDLPPYLIPGSPDEPYWRLENPKGHKLHSLQKLQPGSTKAHHLAQRGRLEELTALLDRDASYLFVKDQNGWTPLHEAVRIGDKEMLEMLLARGADVNARVGLDGQGGSPMNLVDDFYQDPRSPIRQQLLSTLSKFGGKEILDREL